MKKRKNKSLSGTTDIVKTVKETSKSLLPNALEFGAAATGLAAGSFGMKQVPVIASLPAWANKSLPGVAAMVAATLATVLVKNNYVKSAAMGLGLAGMVDVINKNFGDKIPAKYALPQLSGFGNTNYGQYSPEFLTQRVNGFEPGLDLGDINTMNLGAGNAGNGSLMLG